MKTILCKNLGGPDTCEHVFSAESFEELGNASKSHVMEMIQGGDEAHMAAIERMKNMSPEDQQKEFASYQAQFEAAPEV